ncbi:MAG TPA: acyl-CoA dehydrogenase family protein [Chloroflexia bacterium]|nr:acyl-CoA dehydrogenase family protein [Chloroflexia bacterium]
MFEAIEPVPTPNPQPPTPALDLPGLTQVLRAAAEAVDTERRLPYEGLAALADRGLWGARVPREYGGLGLSPAALFDVCAAIGAGCGVTALLYAQHLTALPFLARWGGPSTPDLLQACARGDAIVGLASSQATRRPGGPVQARWAGGRLLLEGTVPWFSGAGLMTHALVAADDPAADPQDGIALAVVPFGPPAVTFSAPVDLIVLGGSQTVSAALHTLDVTAGRLSAPPSRAAVRAAMEGSEAPLRGFNTGLAQAALEICAHTLYTPPETLAVVDWLAVRLDGLCSNLRRALELPGGGDPQATEVHVAGMLNLLWDLGRLVVSAGAGSALKVGAPHNRIAREILYYQARAPYPYIAGLIGVHFGLA